MLGVLTSSPGLTLSYTVCDISLHIFILCIVSRSPYFCCTGAANRFPDKVENDPEGTRKLNIEATRELAKLCAERNVLLIYISTDYVFSGKQGEAPYEADAPTGPTNLYGQTKLDGEHEVLQAYKAAGKQGLGLILRVPVLYGDAELPSESAVNVLMDVLWKAQQGEKVTMEHWALRYPTNTEDVGRVCHGKLSVAFSAGGQQADQMIDLAVKYLAVDDGERAKLPKVLQFSSEDKFTKYEICELFGDIMGLSIENIEPNTQGNDPNSSVQRPYDCHLSTKALKDIGIDVWTQDFTGWWRREVRAFRK